MKKTTWGSVARFSYGRSLPPDAKRDGTSQIFGTNGPTGWTGACMGTGPTVVIGRKGAYRGVHLASKAFWVIDTAFYMEPGPTINPIWAYYCLKQYDINAMDAGSAIPSTRRQDLEALPLDLPDLATQTAIADVLGALDDKIAANERVLRRGDDLLRSRFAHLVNSAEDWVPLSHYLALRYGKSLPSNQRRSGEVPVVGSGGRSGMHDESLVGGPGIVVGRKGSIGTVWWCDRDFWPIDTAFFVEPIGGTGLRFAYALLRWMQLGEHNGDSAVPGLNRDVALAQPVPRVIAELAEDFEAVATPIMNLSQGLREETARLAATRDALLPELMSGRLTVSSVLEDAWR